MTVVVSILLPSLFLLDNPTDIVLQFIKKTFLLPDSQCWISCPSVLEREGTASYFYYPVYAPHAVHTDYDACYDAHLFLLFLIQMI